MKTSTPAGKNNPCRFALFETAMGTCAIAWTDGGIKMMQLPERNARATRARLLERLGRGVEETTPNNQIQSVMCSIKEHLEGDLNHFAGVALDLSGLPPFHRKVYAAARKIPAGKTVSYGQLASAAGSPAAARAVGQALARNPFGLIVPCHRILGHDGSPTGFSAYGGCQAKEKLLLLESRNSPAGNGKQSPASASKQNHLKKSAGHKFNPKDAVAYLSKKDAGMARLIKKVGPFKLEPSEMHSPFEALAEAIVYQQLHGKAAATIFSRVKEIYGGESLPEAKVILKTPDERLRKAGLSASKTLAIKDLADKCHRGLIPPLERLKKMSDQEIVECLTSVRGVGRWTVEMLLIFNLGRQDVLPIHDYGVRKGFALAFGSAGKLPAPKELEEYGERWRPYRSVASWYLWRALELPENRQKKK